VTYKEYRFALEADRIIAGRPVKTLKRRIKLFFAPEYMETFMFLLRKFEYLYDKKGFFQRLSLCITRYRFHKISLKLGFSIYPNVFGPGLYIPHYGTIVVNGHARVGANCVLHTSTCIGGDELKKIGDNAYISSGAIILGAVTIADNTTIGANSLVNKSFSDSNVLIGGVPAKVIKERKAWFECDEDRRFASAVKQIKELHKTMFAAMVITQIPDLSFIDF
jgi:serine O-acetyltransferase